MTSLLTFGTEVSEWVFNLLPTPGSNGVPNPVTSPAQAATYLDGVRQVFVAGKNERPMIRIADPDLNVMVQLTGELSCSVEEIVDDTGSMEVEIDYDNWVVDWITNQTMVIEDLHLIVDPHPSKQNWRTRWGGKIVEIHLAKDDKGHKTVKLKALSFREHAKRLLIAANPIFPPEVQLPRMWVLPGPACTAMALTSFINLARIFMPGWSTITNAFNPAGWINPIGLGGIANVLPTEWPIQIAFIDPVLDQSRWTCVGANWTTTWHEAYKDLLSDAGAFMRVYTYLTTDEDSPNDQLAGLLGGVNNPAAQALAAPRRNCCVFRWENKSGVTGPTGTAADGAINTIAVTLDDLITPVIINPVTGETFDPGQVLNGETVEEASGIGQTYLIEQLTGVAPAPPAVIWWDGTYNGVLTSDLFWHKGSVKTIMIGSHSPILVNEAQTFGIKYGLAELSYLIYGGNPTGPDGGQINSLMPPGTPGLDALYQGQLDDVLLAWERFTDPIRAIYAGDVSWQEHFEKGSSGTAYTIAGVLDLRQGDWSTRAYGTFKAGTYDGYPWVADSDYFLGDRVGFEQNGIIWVDNVYRIKRTWSWDKALDIQVTVGDDKQKQDPFGAAFRTIGMLYSFISTLAGQGTIFTGGGG